MKVVMYGPKDAEGGGWEAWADEVEGDVVVHKVWAIWSQDKSAVTLEMAHYALVCLGQIDAEDGETLDD